MPHIPMPSDFDTPITDDSLGEEIKVSVPADLVRSLKSLAIACGTTLFVTVLGAWKVGFAIRCMSPLPWSDCLMRHSACSFSSVGNLPALPNSPCTASWRNILSCTASHTLLCLSCCLHAATCTADPKVVGLPVIFLRCQKPGH